MASTTTIDVGNFYLREMKERLAKAEAAAPPDVTQKEIDACFTEFRKDVLDHFLPFNSSVFAWDNDSRESLEDGYSFDCKVTLEPGIVVHIDQSYLKVKHPWLDAREELVKKAKANRAACAKACVWRDLLETANINKFKSFVRAAASKPTREDCERLLKDWLALRGHTCPV